MTIRSPQHRLSALDPAKSSLTYHDRCLEIEFSDGHTAPAIQVDQTMDLSNALHTIGLSGSCPVLTIVGGASRMSAESLASLQRLFVEVLAPLVQELGGYVVDGGTDAGVMQMMGQARDVTGGTFPLIGVAAIGTVAFPGMAAPPTESAPLQPHHTHFVLVPGCCWGDESPWLVQVTNTLAAGCPSITLLINGGAITLVDAQENVKAGRPILVIAGSGRLADEIAEVMRHPNCEGREDVAAVVRTGNLDLFDLTQPIADLSNLLKQRLSGAAEDLV